MKSIFSFQLNIYNTFGFSKMELYLGDDSNMSWLDGESESSIGSCEFT